MIRMRPDVAMASPFLGGAVRAGSRWPGSCGRAASSRDLCTSSGALQARAGTPRRTGAQIPARPAHVAQADAAEDHEPEPPRVQPVPRIRPVQDSHEDFEMAELQAPPVIDRTDMLEVLNEALEIDPRRTAVITIDC